MTPPTGPPPRFIREGSDKPLSGRRLGKFIVAATRRARISELLSLETVELAAIGNSISTELARRAEYVLRFGVHSPK
jgi:hypothetical protein